MRLYETIKKFTFYAKLESMSYMSYRTKRPLSHVGMGKGQPRLERGLKRVYVGK